MLIDKHDYKPAQEVMVVRIWHEVNGGEYVHGFCVLVDEPVTRIEVFSQDDNASSSTDV